MATFSEASCHNNSTFALERRGFLVPEDAKHLGFGPGHTVSHNLPD
jgi:hypothetical protein